MDDSLLTDEEKVLVKRINDLENVEAVLGRLQAGTVREKMVMIDRLIRLKEAEARKVG